jgi:carbon storage regulator CsrA
MLVLSRRPNEKILFPGFNTAIQVVSIKGGAVRLGIEAPPEVVVLREELRDRAAVPLLAESADSRLRAFRHSLRNRLNGATIGLALLRKQVSAGANDDLERTIAMIEGEMQSLRQEVEAEAVKAASAPVKTARKKPKALLVEDDQNERELLAGFLRVSGFAVDTAGDGCDALDYLRTAERPDVVLLDMGMPRCDGAATAREIRRDSAYAGLRIFAVSGHLPDEYNLDMGPSGIDRWFHKPLDPAALVREMSKELGSV